MQASVTNDNEYSKPTIGCNTCEGSFQYSLSITTSVKQLGTMVNNIYVITKQTEMKNLELRKVLNKLALVGCCCVGASSDSLYL